MKEESTQLNKYSTKQTNKQTQSYTHDYSKVSFIQGKEFHFLRDCIQHVPKITAIHSSPTIG